MSPLQIEMLLFIHCRREVYADRGGRAQVEVIKWLQANELIQLTNDEGFGAIVCGIAFRTTDRGRALVKKLCEVPLPVRTVTWE